MQYVSASCVVVLVCALVYTFFLAPPRGFPKDTVVHVPTGATISGTAQELVAVGALRYEWPFVLAVSFLGERGVQAGSYALETPQNAFVLAYRAAQGQVGQNLVRVTIPEGTTVSDMAAILKQSLQNFDTQAFLSEARQYEGYLFPDTYFLLPGMPEHAIIERMRANYVEKYQTFKDAVETSGRTEHEIITMASLLEKEARQRETMQEVSGILWKRVDIGMPLQVDAVFGYIKDVPTFNPSFADLEIDSPYNTYKNRGLPPGPIGNPGLDAIYAALNPIESPYLYYLTGKDGTMHYARTFEQHVANRRFLR
jgi:UPF0755 protein